MSPFLITTILLSYAALLTCAKTSSEIEALLDFKLKLNDPLGSLAGWNGSTPSAPCDWRGVTCSSSSLVTDLRLPRSQLHGALSNKLANLRMLRRLSLQFNSFSGNLPPEIFNLNKLLILDLAGNRISGEAPVMFPASLRYLDLSVNTLSGELPLNLPDLQYMNLSYNMFTGAIPEMYGALQKLQFLSIEENLLEGTLPSALANCTSLVHFSADGNAIGGVIPPGIGSIRSLQVLSLSSNKLSGLVPVSIFCNVSDYRSKVRVVKLGFNAFTDIVPPSSSGCISVVQVLELQNNEIRGGFPLWFSNLTGLTSLDVSGNRLTGGVPSEIGGLKRLEELKLANNSLTGLFPSEIKEISGLRVLNLEGNLFSGEIPKFLTELKELKVLYLGGNRFNGSVPSGFSSLSQLDTLSLRDNSLTGSLPEDLMSMSNLTTLELGGNRFSGDIPVTIGNLKGLSVLNLSGNEFSGMIPGSIGSLYKLTALDLSRQNLTGELPLDLFGLPNLQVIALQENMFSGDVPEGFSSLLGLHYLNLSSNMFSGHIPSTFSFLKSLVVLSLSSNNVSGTIPPELGNCSDLQILDLGSNTLFGRIPTDLSRLSLLTQLDLSNNNLSGDIPESLSHLSNLNSLDLSSNNLTGEIPANLTAVSSLMYFNVSNNDLEGKIPDPLASRFNNESVYEGNSGLCGKPLDRKCKGEGRGTNKRMILLIVVAVAGAIFMSICCCFYTYSLFKWRKKLIERAKLGEKKRTSPQRSSGTRSSGENGGPKLVMFNNKITLAETLEATRQFDEENVLSRTRFGLIFKACYNDGMVLSIRRLQNGLLDETMFKKEAELLGKVRHRNLTVLRGYYAGPPDLRLLVYDYMPNGNLATLLQEASHQDGHVLNWPMRHLIALGIARGISFLHSTTMVHGDIKPQNVLFDADFEAHVSEFGLTPLATNRSPEASATSTSGSVGTLGYVSPEAILTGEVTKESDVYSFGIVLLELLTGKKPVMFTQDEDIVKWVKRQLQTGQVSELLEPGLLELDPESSEWEEFLLGVKVGLLCTAPDPHDRPTMADIVFMLEGCRVGPDIPSSADPTSQPSPA
ncbi:probable LRR receptor-like serine/threonine-protein kinase [Tanacetum coccineum]